MILGCEDCGEDLPYVEIDGYAVGDRLLEGVVFHFFPNRSVKVRDEDAEYFDGLNNRKWLKRIQEFVLETGGGICPTCKKDAYVEE
jgi:hypothetical protein